MCKILINVISFNNNIFTQKIFYFTTKDEKFMSVKKTETYNNY